MKISLDSFDNYRESIWKNLNKESDQVELQKKQTSMKANRGNFGDPITQAAMHGAVENTT